MDALAVRTISFELLWEDVVYVMKKALSDLQDEKLVGLVAKGNGEAFQILFTRYSRAVLGFVQKMMRSDWAMAEDIAQVAWENILRACPEFVPNAKAGKFSGWIFTVARNTALNELRRQGRWRAEQFDDEALPHNDAQDAQLTSEEFLIRLSESQELKRRIDNLPDRQRVVLLAWLNSDRKQSELAEELGLTAKSFEMLLRRARKALFEGKEEDKQ